MAPRHAAARMVGRYRLHRPAARRRGTARKAARPQRRGDAQDREGPRHCGGVVANPTDPADHPRRRPMWRPDLHRWRQWPPPDQGELRQRVQGRVHGGWRSRISAWRAEDRSDRSEEHTSELQSLMRISYAVFCLNKKIKNTNTSHKQMYTQHSLP